MNPNINEALKEHEMAVKDWNHCELAQNLYVWADRFNVEFKLNIETPAIQIDHTRIQAIGTYRRGRNGFGLHHEITFNVKYLDRPFADQLDTLLHELLHEWQELHGKPSTNSYHNKEFREKALSYGLVIDAWGIR